jgi:hypothetical protein
MKLLAIRRHLLSMNTLSGLMLWCMIIVGVKAFLRVEEVLTLQYESFLPKYFVIKGNEVICLLIKIRGKRDNRFITFALWDDPNFPELSPVRPVLVYLAITGITGGYLFPNLAQLSSSRNPTAHYEYANILSDIRYLCQAVLKKDLGVGDGLLLIAGTHILRKTAFLLAYWGKKMELLDMDGRQRDLPVEDQASLLLDARHKDVASTMTYLGDSATLFALHKLLGMNDPNQKVGPYLPIFVKVLSNFLTLSTEGDLSTPINARSLSQISTWFVHHCLSVARTVVLKDCISRLCQKATELTPLPINTNEVDAILLANLSPRDYSLVKQSMEGIIMRGSNAVHNETHSQPGNHPESDPDSQQGKNQDIIDASHQIQLYNRATSKIDKVNILVLACQEIKVSVDLNWKWEKKSKNWAHKAAKIVACVRQCHQGQADLFVHTTKDFQLKKFTCANDIRHTGGFTNVRY